MASTTYQTSEKCTQNCPATDLSVSHLDAATACINNLTIGVDTVATREWRTPPSGTTEVALQPTDSGTVVALDLRGPGELSFALPAPAPGLRYTFVAAAPPGPGTATVAASAAILHGLVTSATSTPSNAYKTDKTSFTFSAAAPVGVVVALTAPNSSIWVVNGRLQSLTNVTFAS